MSSDTARLEREAEAHRASLDATFDAIRNRLSLGQMVDEVTAYLKDGQGADTARNLGRQVRDNPLALAVAGAGLAWLCWGNGVRASSVAPRRLNGGDDATAGMMNTARDAANSASATAGAMVDTATGGMRDAAGMIVREPLVFGAVALAIGAAVGAMLPATRTEDDLMGETRDQLRDDAYTQGKELVQDVTEASADTHG